MKKMFAIVLVLSLTALLFTSCETKEGPAKAFSDMSLEEILSAVYQNGSYSKNLTALINAPVPDPDSFSFDNYLVTTEINSSNCEYFLGKSDIEFERAIASEASMNPTTYSLCLIQAKPEQDVDALAETIRKNADPMKWVCTGLPEDNVYVDIAGNIVILVMSATDGEALLSAFRSIASEYSDK